MNKLQTAFNNDGFVPLPGAGFYFGIVTFATTGVTVDVPLTGNLRRFIPVGQFPLGAVAGDEGLSINGAPNADGTYSATDNGNGTWKITFTRTGASPLSAGSYGVLLIAVP